VGVVVVVVEAVVTVAVIVTLLPCAVLAALPVSDV
jgi:hypothetical protein